MIKKGAHIGIIGCQGRMGQSLVQEARSAEAAGQLVFAGGTVRPDAPLPNTGFFVTASLEDLLQRANILIDFTRPDVTIHTVWLAAKHHIPCIIGTTGLNTAQEKEIQDASKECAIVYAANMSIGITLLSALVEQAAKKLGAEWDIEVLETHHKRKIDAPSGTALMLCRATGRNAAPLDRSGKRAHGTLGFAVRRGGDVVGEHTVSFYGEGERIELSHIATDRRLFARGAIEAALWAAHQKPGLYSMRDVLGL